MVNIPKTTPLDLDMTDIRRLLIKLNYTYKSEKEHESPHFSNINTWFSQNAIKKLSKLKHAIEAFDCSDDLKDFLWLCFARVVRKVSRANFKEILILKDSIRKKGMITRRHNSGGLINEEFNTPSLIVANFDKILSKLQS